MYFSTIEKKKATHEISHIQIFNFLLTPPQIIKKENTTEVYKTRNPHADIKRIVFSKNGW